MTQACAIVLRERKRIEKCCAFEVNRIWMQFFKIYVIEYNTLNGKEKHFQSCKYKLSGYHVTYHQISLSHFAGLYNKIKVNI